MSNVQVCDFADNLVGELKKFRFSKAKTSRAIIMKIDTNQMKVLQILEYSLNFSMYFPSITKDSRIALTVWFVVLMTQIV